MARTPQLSKTLKITILIRKLNNTRLPINLILGLPIFIFRVISSVNCMFVMSCIITSFQYFFSLFLPFLIPTIVNPSHLFIGASVHLLFTCSNHLSLASPVLSTSEVTTPTLFGISSFLIMSLLVCPTHLSQHLHFRYCHFLNVRLLDWPTFCPVYIAGLTTTL